MSTEAMPGEITRTPTLKAAVLDAVVTAFLILSSYFHLADLTEDQVLDMSRNAGLGLVALVAGAIFGLFVNLGLNRRSLGATVFPRRGTKPIEAEAWYRTFWGWQFLVVFISMFVVGVGVTKFSFYELFSREGFAGATRLFNSLAHPDWRILPQGVLGIVETIFIAFIATVLAIPFAFVLSFYASKNLPPLFETRGGSSLQRVLRFFFGFGPLKYFGIRTVINLVRSCEPVMWAIIFSVWVGIGPFPGMLALLVHAIASLTKQYSEQIEGISSGPVEGIQSAGAGTLQVIWYAIVPQVVLPFVAYTLDRWDINVRMATILGLVGAGGIGSLLIQAQGQAAWEEVGALIFLIALVVWLMDMASAHIREAIK